MTVLSRSAAFAAALGFCVFTSSAGARPATTRPLLATGSGTTTAGLFRAGDDGAEFSVCGGRLRVSPGGEIRLFPVAQRLSLSGKRSASTWSLLVRQGRADVELPRPADGAKRLCAVLATAPRKLSTLVLGGRALVSARADEVSVANLGGEVLASTGDAFRPLPEFHSRTLRDDSAGEPRPLLDGPERIHGQQALISIGAPASVRWLSWQPVRSATGYAVELTSSDGSVLARTRTREPALGETLSKVGPGIYTLLVSALDGFGIEGRPTSATLRVIGANVPEGAFVDAEGQIRLAEGQTVQFENVEGLEVTYSSAGHFRRAPRDVGLYRNGATLVHFRVPGASQSVRAKLAPRGITARVFAGPKTARWPDDSVLLRVDLTDEQGRALPEWLDAHPRVMLGIDPIDVEWTREGRTLRAKVPAQTTPGPWVIRVDVVDQFGLPLGRDFVEIEHGRRAPARSARTKPPARTDRVSAR